MLLSCRILLTHRIQKMQKWSSISKEALTKERPIYQTDNFGLKV